MSNASASPFASGPAAPLPAASIALHAALPEPAPSVTLRGLRVAHGRQIVLDGLDWALVPGQVVGLLGRNGAGKTTLLETLLGLREPEAGEARMFDQPALLLDDALRARIGYVPQQSDLFEWLTPTQMLAYFKSFYPRWNDAKVDALLTQWAIARDRPIGRLSGGEQQRLAIVRALAHEPDLLVLDEPVASLDPAGRRDFLRELVEQVLNRGTTVVFSTHILSDLERVAFNVAFLNGGRIALQAPLDELLETTRRVQGPAAAVGALIAAQRASVLRETATDAAGRHQALVRFAADAPVPGGVGSVSVEPVTLEDLFMGLTQ